MNRKSRRASRARGITILILETDRKAKAAPTGGQSSRRNSDVLAAHSPKQKGSK